VRIMTFISRLLKNQRGSALMEYLMLIILVSAVIVPIILTNFGDPFLQTMKNERQKMVTFFAQTPRGRQKPPVPASWFSQELPAKIESEQIQGGETIGEGQNLETGEIQGGQAIRAGSELKGGADISGGQAINSGQVGSGTLRGAGGEQEGRGGGGAGGDDFFSVPSTPGVGAEKSSSLDKSSESSRRSGGGGGGLVALEEKSLDPISRAATGRDEKGKGGKEESQMISDKKGSLVAAEQDVRERQDRKKFDWWLLIKILIVLGIIALLILILLGSTRRSG